MEKPILFNTEMVKAILNGKKTCTRRIIKRTPSNDEPCGYGFWKEFNKTNNTWYVKDYTHSCTWWSLKEYINKFSRFHIGDILYVRETWKKYTKRIGKGENCMITEFYGYKADEDNPNNSSEFYEGNWKPSIHMPKEAARIFLEVTEVKVERLQDITEEGCLKEGVINRFPKIHDRLTPDILRGGFINLWDSTVNRKDIDKYGFKANPWVWVIEFKVKEVKR